MANRAIKYEAGLFDGTDTRAGRVTVAPLPDGSRLGSDQLEISAAWRSNSRVRSGSWVMRARAR